MAILQERARQLEAEGQAKVDQAYADAPAKYHKHIQVLRQSRNLAAKGSPPVWANIPAPYMRVDGRIAMAMDEHMAAGMPFDIQISEVEVFGKACIRARVASPLRGERFGTAEIGFGGTGADSTNPVENAETSAIGRALGFMGYALYGGIASAEEVLQAIKQQEKQGDEKTDDQGDPPSQRQIAFLRDLLEQEGHSERDIETTIGRLKTREEASEMISELRSGGKKKVKSGLKFAAEVDHNGTFTGNFTDGDGNVLNVDPEPEEDDIPDPMTVAQRGKLNGMLNQIGVLDGDKTDLLNAMNLNKRGAFALIEELVEEGADHFPETLFSKYLRLLQHRAEVDDETVVDYCRSTFKVNQPFRLDRQQRDTMIAWLSLIKEWDDGTPEMDDDALFSAWVEGARVTADTLATMTKEEIDTAIAAWHKREASTK